jgi:Protein of unknown function (DUF3574)
MRLLKTLAVIAAVMLPPAAAAQQLTCPAPGKAMLRAELYFGRNIGGHLGVGDKQWQAFLRRELTPRFPDGLSVLEAQGQWRDKSGRTVREPSKIVIVVVPDDTAARAKLDAAAAAYKKRFHQESVAVLTRPVCAEF